MNTRQKQEAELDRRKVLLLSLGGASALVLAQRGGASAQLIEEKGSIERKVSKPVDSMIPGFKKVRFREITYQPGARSKAKMQDAMICECSQGTLEVMQDDKKFTVKKGDVWTCHTGLIEANENKGSGPATMRVFDLLTT